MKVPTVVAVQSNLVGRLAYPTVGLEHAFRLKDDKWAEIVAVFVGDFDEGGALKLGLRGSQTGKTAVVYFEHVVVGEER